MRLSARNDRHFRRRRCAGPGLRRWRFLADAGLADQHRIILGSTAENLDDAIDFAVAADEWVELAVHGGLGQVAGELRQQR